MESQYHCMEEEEKPDNVLLPRWAVEEVNARIERLETMLAEYQIKEWSVSRDFDDTYNCAKYFIS